MDRLTHRLDLGLDEWEQIAFKNPNDEQGLYNIVDVVEHRDEEWARQILLSLAETVADYEDTGLTPEQIREINDFFNSQTAKILAELREYQRAEENGLLLRLPCRVGDIVYSDSEYFGILSYEVNSVHICIGISFEAIASRDDEMLDAIDFDIEDIGKTVFLTREEAEAKLAEMEGKHE